MRRQYNIVSPPSNNFQSTPFETALVTWEINCLGTIDTSTTGNPFGFGSVSHPLHLTRLLVLQQLDGRHEHRLASRLEEIQRIAPVLLNTINLAPAVAMALSFNISLDDNAYFTAGPAARNSIVNEVISVSCPYCMTV